MNFKQRFKLYPIVFSRVRYYLKNYFFLSHELLFMIMRVKIIITILLVSSFHLSASVYAQRINLNEKKVQMVQILNKIEKQVGYTFFYNKRDLQQLKPVTIVVNNERLDVTLDKIFADQPLGYALHDKIIVIKKIDPLGSLPSIIPSESLKVQEDIIGQVTDSLQNPLPRVSIQIKGTTRGTSTDNGGKFRIPAKSGDILSFSAIGYRALDIEVTDQRALQVILTLDSSDLEEVVITAWGKEKKTTMVGAVSTINPKELRGPTSNLTSMLQGRVAGLISYQTSGEPGRDNAEFFIRGVGSFGTGRVSPLILINGIESTTTELARIQPDDIEGFSILKDATATSMYGSRGANGVILISTKSGKIGKTKFNVRYESSISTNAKDYNLADNISYMELANEASLTRGKERIYSFEKIDKTKNGANPLLYPNNNWRDIMIKDYTQNHRVNLNASGGGDVAKFYLSGSYRFDNGMLRTHKANDFETNVQSTSLEIRSNIDLKLTNSTQASVRVNGLFDGLNGPAVGNGSAIFQSMLKANPVAFPAVIPQEYRSWVKHPLFGNATIDSPNEFYYNPYASALTGYKDESSSFFTAQLDLSQQLDFLTKGLKAQMMAYTKRSAGSSFSRSVAPFYYNAVEDMNNKGQVGNLVLLNETGGREYLNYAEGGKSLWSENWLQGSLAYERIFGEKHHIGTTLLGYVREKKLSNAGSLERSLPQRNISLSGRATYGFDNRYMAEFNFGYNASERFNLANRWGFFPSVGLAWNIANENFMKELPPVNKLKVRLSYGMVGNDELTDWFNNGEERFFYLNMMNMNAGSISFGSDYGKTYSTVAVSRYANSNITWEKSYKSNIALEIGLFNSLNIEVDLFRDKRTNILMTRNDIPTTMGLRSVVRANIGELRSQGMEISADYSKSFNQDFWATVRGTFTYSRNKTLVYEEPKYGEDLYYKSKIGYPWHTIWGYVAERLFIDEEDVANAPSQFGDYLAGDIKYHDVNRDGIINDNDMVPMGYPSQPEINYGFGFSTGYKGFDLSAFFSGIAHVSFMVNPATITPFVRSGDQYTGLLEVIANDHWSEDNRNPYAFFPRLSTTQIANNNRNSSWWLRDGAFLKLATLELGYEPKDEWVKKRLKLDGIRVYANGTNLFKISKFKMWDAEMKGNGMGYPLQRVFNVGLQVSF